ncbi:MAG: hypothetical protein OXQ29_25505, partial [Rhodospirillaceae bacterium]|nr:hypothetical protein [Rhodospirillaceae bacterium]
MVVVRPVADLRLFWASIGHCRRSMSFQSLVPDGWSPTTLASPSGWRGGWFPWAVPALTPRHAGNREPPPRSGPGDAVRARTVLRDAAFPDELGEKRADGLVPGHGRCRSIIVMRATAVAGGAKRPCETALSRHGSRETKRAVLPSRSSGRPAPQERLHERRESCDRLWRIGFRSLCTVIDAGGHAPVRSTVRQPR